MTKRGRKKMTEAAKLWNRANRAIDRSAKKQSKEMNEPFKRIEKKGSKTADYFNKAVR